MLGSACIVGGGIGGLAAASLPKRSVALYERGSALRAHVR
jgi:flavin-dependent dehydrogenase